MNTKTNQTVLSSAPNEAWRGIVDTRISGMHQVLPPVALTESVPPTEVTEKLVAATRHTIHNIIRGDDDRLLVISGPCSIHDPEAALDYGARLLQLRQQYAGELEIIMRVYFEKPRTTVGWKGLINDPDLNDSHNINRGLRIGRRLLFDLNQMGVPAATEFLDPITVQYLDEFISWGAIGARTTESQLHRQLASGLSMPVGFKNATDGSVKIAVDAVIAARHEHTFLSVTKMGHVTIVHTRGNDDCHIILRGGHKPNYFHADVDEACQALTAADIYPSLMIDFSHSNSQKHFKRQLDVGSEVAAQIAEGDTRIFGAMIESNLVEGRQDLTGDVKSLRYGQSITDACINLEDTAKIFEDLAAAVRTRRSLKAQ